jgi:glycerophosphoryl diester phosphodiesterase
MTRPALVAVVATLAAALPAVAVQTATDPAPASRVAAAPVAIDPDRPLVVGHRGASGYRPEHTLASYELAARMGADYIEPDLVSTKDGVLVARHENEISGTTDVGSRPEFADRRTTRTIDGVALTGWFTEDFTLRELRTLRAVERIPALRQENTLHDGLYQVPTFAEVLELRASLSKELRREIGVYPEIKHPTYFRSIGLSLEEPLVRDLKKARMNDRNDPVFVQAFELTPLQRLRTELGLRVPTVFLTGATGAPYDLVAAGDPRTYADLTTRRGLQSISGFVDGLGPEKNQVIPRTADGSLGQPTALVADAHRAGMQVHPYTFRAENSFLPPVLRSSPDVAAYGDVLTEMQAYLDAGVDGFFTDQPDLGVLARDTWDG